MSLVFRLLERVFPCFSVPDFLEILDSATHTLESLIILCGMKSGVCVIGSSTGGRVWSCNGRFDVCLLAFCDCQHNFKSHIKSYPARHDGIL